MTDIEKVLAIALGEVGYLEKETREHCRKMVEETRKECDRMLEEAKKQANVHLPAFFGEDLHF